MKQLCFLLCILLACIISSRASIKSPTQLKEDRQEYKLLCYYGSWSHWNPHKAGKLSPDAIDPFLCTHILYAFAVLSDNYTITSNDPYLDLNHGAYAKVTGLKKINPLLKVLISIGGWDDGSVKYSNMAAKPETRELFVQSVLLFLKEHNFDGIDLDWEYPSQRGGYKEDKKNFVILLKELRKQLKPKGYLMTAAVASTKFIAHDSYDIPQLNYLLDFVNVMTYDFYGPWTYVVGHNSPLFVRKNDQKELSVESSIKFWLESGISREKLVMGIPMYARSFTLREPSDFEPHAIARGPGNPGPINNANGTLSLPEVCLLQKKGGTRVFWDHDWRAPYLVVGDQWVAYENVSSAKFKTDFVKEMRLGGAMIWSLDLDDISGSCNGVLFPLMYTVSDALRIRDMKDQPDEPMTRLIVNSAPIRSRSKALVLITVSSIKLLRNHWNFA